MKLKRPLFALCLLYISILAVLTALGIFSTEDNASLLPPNKSHVSLTGRICKTDSAYYYIDQIHFASPPQTSELPAHFRLLISTSEFTASTKPDIGNIVSISGKFRQFTHATNPGEFDSYDYYSSQNIYGNLSNIQCKIISTKRMILQYWLGKISSYGMRSLNQQFSEAEASVMRDMLFGDKAGLDQDVRDLYRRNGISHILSISSLHISILGLGLYQLLKKMYCPNWIAATVSGLLLILFGIMTGLSLSSMRAIGIYLIGVLAKLTGRTVDRLTSIFLVATILLAINPRQLTSCGFLLSFGSVLGICCLYPSIKALLPSLETDVRYSPDTRRTQLTKRLKKTGIKIIDSLIAGISISLTTLPIQLYFFYEIPCYSVILNLMVIPLLSILMISGYAATFLPFLKFPAFICHLILIFYEFSGKIFDHLPYNNWNPGRPSPPLIISYYIFWLAIVLLPSIRRHLSNHRFRFTPKAILIFLRLIPALITLLFIFLLNIRSLPKNSVVFMDVGQGDCILVYTDSREAILIDGGSSSRSSPGAQVIKNVLKYYGLSHLSAIYLSHSDSDHTNGILELVENSDNWNIRIDNIYIPEFRKWDKNAKMQQLCSRLTIIMQRCVSNVSRISAGCSNTMGSVVIACLHPSADFSTDDSNSASACLLIEFTDSHLKNAPDNSCTTLLLCGDIVGEGERLLADILRQYPPVTLLKVSHHGSKYSTTDTFLNATRPRLAFISVGKNNIYGHPHRETLDRLHAYGCDFFTTAESGAITVNVSKKHIEIHTYRQ